MGEAERASKAWKNMLGVSHRRRLFRARAPDTEKQTPEPKEYRWYSMADGREVYRPVIQPNDKRSHLPSPQISLDYEAYDCPITGNMVEGRRAHRENLKKHDCRILEPGERREYKKDKPKEIERQLEKDCQDAAYAAARDYFA